MGNDIMLKDIAGVVALIGVVFTAGVVFTTITSDIDELKEKVGEIEPTSSEKFVQGNILLKSNRSTCPDGWDELGRTSLPIEIDRRGNFEKHMELRGSARGWPAADFLMCLKE